MFALTVTKKHMNFWVVANLLFLCVAVGFSLAKTKRFFHHTLTLFPSETISVFCGIMMMKSIKNKLSKLAAGAQVKMEQFLRDESGMEIIQVLILLAIGLVLIGAFIGFKDAIMERVDALVGNFLKGF